ncbi:MAG: Fic family protein [Candidatus Woesearchaeota archaeon]
MIIKRKKGSKEYYYMQQSFRREGKVITKTKYLGKELPQKEEIEKIKISLLKEKKNNLNIKLERIKAEFQKQWKTLPESIKQREFNEIAISFTYNTNAIEGSTITLEETREILENQIAPNKSLRDIKETESHARVFLEMLRNKDKITKELILEWHKRIFEQTKPEMAGRFREYLVRIGDYRPPDWQEVKSLMDELMVFISKNKGMNSVELSARVHYRFEKIHPFGDGNGRIGRLLMNKMLWHSGYPMLIIGYKKRKSYYKALRKTEEQFANYFIRYYLSSSFVRNLS